MNSIPYINYSGLAEFYTIQQLTELFNMSKQELKAKCAQYGIFPRQNEVGEYGFVRYDVRKLHNQLYYEGRDKSKGNGKVDDPWA